MEYNHVSGMFEFDAFDYSISDILDGELELHLQAIKEEEMKEEEREGNKLTGNKLTGDRYNGGKLKWGLVDFNSLKPLVQALEYGATKYTPYNWQKGLSYVETLESILRHVHALIQGEDIDPESGVSHIGHVQANAMFLRYMMVNRRDLDDRHKEQPNQYVAVAEPTPLCSQTVVHRYVDAHITSRWLLHNLPKGYLSYVDGYPDCVEFGILDEKGELVGELSLESYIVIDPIKGITIMDDDLDVLVHKYEKSADTGKWLKDHLPNFKASYYKCVDSQDTPYDTFSIIKDYELIGVLKINDSIHLDPTGDITIVESRLSKL